MKVSQSEMMMKYFWKNFRPWFLIVATFLLPRCGSGFETQPIPEDASIVEAGNPAPLPQLPRPIQGLVRDPRGRTCLADEIVALDTADKEVAQTLIAPECKFSLSLATDKMWAVRLRTAEGLEIPILFPASIYGDVAEYYFHEGAKEAPIDLGFLRMDEDFVAADFNPLKQVDRDKDRMPDYWDMDDDGDGIADLEESDCDADGVDDAVDLVSGC